MEGTDTRKIHRQPSSSVMIPETTDPRTRPRPATAAHTLSARDLRGPPGNMSTTTAIAAGSAIASPAPCSSRAGTSTAKDGASPASKDAAPERAVPGRRMRRLPSTSPGRPPSISSPPPVIVHPTTTQVSA
ncbi:hypothetical protein SUDANB15_00363 [Streptomyces sp. enrichment culture]